MHHLLKHINQDLKTKQDKDSTVHKAIYRSKISTGKPCGPDNSQSIRPLPSLQKISIHVGTVIESEVRPTSVQLKRKAKLPTTIGLSSYSLPCM